MAQVRVGGRWLAQLPAVVADLKWATFWGDGASGPSAASWTMDLALEAEYAFLRPGSIVEILQGGTRVWYGVLTEPQRGRPWTFSAVGLARAAGDYLARSATAPTTNPNTAVATAIAAGLPWVNVNPFPNAALGDAAPVNMNRLDTLLSEVADKNGRRWGVDKAGYPFYSLDPTTPKYMLDAAEVEIGLADDGLYNVVYARYVTTVTNGQPSAWATVTAEDATAIARFGRREFFYDLTKLGAIAGATAQSYANSVLADLIKPAWVNRITVNSQSLRTLGGAPVTNLGAVKAGEVVRLFGVRNSLGRVSNQFSVDVVIGETDYEDGADELLIGPAKLAARSFRDVLDELVPRAEFDR